MIFLGVENNTYKQSCEITMTQRGLKKEFMKIVGILDSNNNTTTEATITLVTDANGHAFGEPWDYVYVVGILVYLSRNYRTDI